MLKTRPKGALREPRQAGRLLFTTAIGALIGMALGWVVMGTAHAILEVGASKPAVGTSHAATTATPGSAATTATTAFPTNGEAVHVIMTGGGGFYQGFQSRVMYATFLAAQKQPGGDKLAGFTRILHRVEPDALMDEIPTFHVQPLQPECDNWCDFPPASRPDAVRQFFDAAKADPSLIKAPWVFLTEPDYVWIKPLQAPKAEDAKAHSRAFPFGYIVPQHANLRSIMARYYSGPAEDIPGTGPAPALLRISEWLQILPDWEEVTAAFEVDAEAKKELGWVREMYAFSIACARKKVRLDLDRPPRSPLMVQPPADAAPGAAPIFHYTWGSIVSDKAGKELWRFDKREYTDKRYQMRPERLPAVPKYDAAAGWQLQDNKTVSAELRDTLALMIDTMNAAIDTLPPLE